MAVVALVRAGGAEDCWDGGTPEDMIIIIIMIILLAVRWLVGFRVKKQDRTLSAQRAALRAVDLRDDAAE